MNLTRERGIDVIVLRPGDDLAACVQDAVEDRADALSVDRRDLVGSLGAFIDGVELPIDVAEVNGRVFLNNGSLGSTATRFGSPRTAMRRRERCWRQQRSARAERSSPRSGA